MVAEHFGIELYDKNLLMITARESGIASEFFAKQDERPSALGRFVRFLGIGGPVYSDAYGYGYVKALAQTFYGIPETDLICAEGLDLDGADPEAILQAAEKEISCRYDNSLV